MIYAIIFAIIIGSGFIYVSTFARSIEEFTWQVTLGGSMVLLGLGALIGQIK